MINWAEIDQDFLAVAKDYQDRYDGKGSFLKPGEERVPEAPSKVFARAELTVSMSEAASPDGGIPVRLEIKDERGTRWAAGWLPTCAVTDSEGMSEGEIGLVSRYLKVNAAAIAESYVESFAQNQDDPSEAPVEDPAETPVKGQPAEEQPVSDEA